MKSPISQASAGAIALCGELLQRGKPIIIHKDLIDSSVLYFEQQGMIRIVSASPSSVQIFMV